MTDGNNRNLWSVFHNELRNLSDGDDNDDNEESDCSEPDNSDFDPDYYANQAEPADSASDNQSDGDDSDNSTSSDSAESVDNEGEDPPPQQVWKGKDGSTWNKQPPTLGRAGANNVIRTEGRMENIAGPLESPIDAAKLFLTDELLQKILLHTNAEVKRVAQEKGGASASFNSITKDELESYLGILIKAGALGMQHLDIHTLWSNENGPAFIKSAMARDRFKQIHSRLRFDDKSTRQNRREESLLAPIKEINDDVQKLLKRYYTPGAFITVDEQLVGFRGRCAFRMYMPAKPDRYGMKIFMAADSKTLYPLTFLPYLGRQTSDAAGGQGLGQYAVTNLVSRFFNAGRNVTCDRFFTSMPLATTLMDNKTTIVGTIMSNKRCIPPELVDVRGRQVESSVFVFQPKTTLVSYVPKPKKNVLLLSTQHHNNDIVVEENNKPEIILFYNQTKGAVDTVDWMVKRYTCRRKSKRWPVVYFLNLVDLCMLAAYIIYNLKNPGQANAAKRGERKKFLMSVGESLMKSNVEQRYQTGVARVKRTIRESGLLTVPEQQALVPPEPPKRKRCGKCPQSKDGKFKTICQVCRKNLCPLHSVTTCETCFRDAQE